MKTYRLGLADAMPSDEKALLEKENRRLKARIAELERLVATDTLTPLYNRRFLLEELDRWCWRAHRYGGSFGLLYLDVDRLKLVNDTHGHAAGDAVLCGIAAELQTATRKSDILARMGGDEFAVLLDSIPAGKLADKTLSLRSLFCALPVQTSGPVLKNRRFCGILPDRKRIARERGPDRGRPQHVCRQAIEI